MDKYCDTTEKLAWCAEKSKPPNVNIYLAQYTRGDKLNGQHDVTNYRAYLSLTVVLEHEFACE
jgi:hypothetical protein